MRSQRTIMVSQFQSKREKLDKEKFINDGSQYRFKWKCEKCSMLFKNRKNLYNHKSEVHGY